MNKGSEVPQTIIAKPKSADIARGKESPVKEPHA
jgi:hypothetical protein